jgi:hypothetical protein
MRLLALLLLCGLALSSAGQSRRRAVSRTPPAPAIVHVDDDFRLGARGWEAAFADYSPVSLPTMDLDSGIRPLPAELGISGTGFYIRGHNRSDDLWMQLTRKVSAADGIAPNTLYEINFRVTLGSNAGGGCFGVGGAPGEGVYLKTGASGTAPLVQLVADHYEVNFDKGNQAVGGTEASIAGDIVNGTTDCSDTAPFRTIVRTHQHTHLVRSNAAGEIWLIVGTDSAFEGLTQLYYQSVEATLQPR